MPPATSNRSSAASYFIRKKTSLRKNQYSYFFIELQLRYLQTLNNISAEKNSTIVFPIPIDIISQESFGLFRNFRRLMNLIQIKMFYLYFLRKISYRIKYLLSKGAKTTYQLFCQSCFW